MARNFANRMGRVGDLLLVNVSTTIRKAAIAAATQVIQRTPVATGRARSSWKVSSGVPKGGVVEGANTDKQATNAQVASAKALINASNAIKNWKVGKGNIFIANSVSYIGDLDRGTSKQASAGMTVFAIAAAKGVLRQGGLLRGR